MPNINERLISPRNTTILPNLTHTTGMIANQSKICWQTLTMHDGHAYDVPSGIGSCIDSLSRHQHSEQRVPCFV